MKSPFAQPEKTRVANVTIAKSGVLTAQVLRILSRKGFSTAKSIANPSAYLKNDPAKQPIAASYTVLRECLPKGGGLEPGSLSG
jgi:hypothetical protein